MVAGSRIVPGVKPGDRRFVVARPRARYFRSIDHGVLVAKPAADDPTRPADRTLVALRRGLLGRPLASHEEAAERLPVWKALAIFSSDVMSSVAYATEAILFTLLAAGTGAFSALMPISGAIVALLLIVTVSYRQTIRAYPNGGGSYVVARANLGTLAGLVAAAALLCDYVLTVAVSVSSGVWTLASAAPALLPWTVPLIVGFILAVMLVNLRGIRESGTVFAGPTYLFIGGMLVMIAVGLTRTVLGAPPQVSGVQPAAVTAEGLGLMLVLRAFASGCSAMTGTEAVANGVPAFKPPEWIHARTTMLVMSALLATMFLGTSYLATVTNAVPSDRQTVLAQIARAVFGEGPLFYVLVAATMGILVLAAETSFAGFPQVASMLARDGFMPRRFSFRGERLAFSTGIVALALVAAAVVIPFGGRVEALIPLYAIGVFVSFTLSQAGMVRHWFSVRGAAWRRSAVLNATGAIATGVVTVIFAVAKFSHGAWVVMIVIPILVAAMLFVRHEYTRREDAISVATDVVIGPPMRRRRVVVAATRLDRSTVQAVQVARTIAGEVQIVHVVLDEAEAERFRDRAARHLPGIAVVTVESPYRTLVRPLIHYLEVLTAEDPDAIVVVLLPEQLTVHWWDRLLFNQNAHQLRRELTGRHHIVVLDVPYRRSAGPWPTTTDRARHQA